MALSIKGWRGARELTQEEMAERLGVHRSTYILWEKNPENISIANAAKVAKVLGVKMNDIIFLPENSTEM